MKHNTIPKLVGLACFALASITPLSSSQAAAFAAHVVHYDPGAGATLTTPSAALGQPGAIVGQGSSYDSILSPFSPHYEDSQLTQVGEGGSITLRLANFAVVTAGSPEIGVFTNLGLADTDWPNGQAGLGAAFASFGRDSAIVEVSDDAQQWFNLGNIGFDQPSTAFTDAPSPYAADASGLTPADFGLPHGNALADYDGLDWQSLKAKLGDSAGGKWLDFDATGLAMVGWIRFSVPDDGDANTQLTFDLDAVSIANASVGAAIPEPSTTLLAVLGVATLVVRRRRK